MAAAADHVPIRAVSTISGNSAATDSKNEKASQVFLSGVPVQLNAGVIQEWDGATVAFGIAGVALQQGSNLASDGLGAPSGFSGVTGLGASLTFGSVQGQTAAKNIAHGSPAVDGRTLFEKAVQDTEFEGQIDSSGGAANTGLLSDEGKQYGMTKDATGHWYVDKQKSTVGTNTVVVVTKVHPLDVGLALARVRFRFLVGASQSV